MRQKIFVHTSDLLRSKSFYPCVIVAAALMITICNYGVRLSYSVFFKPMMQDFGWTRAMTAGSYSLCTVILGVFSIVFGWLSDRYGTRITLTICGVFSGMGIILLSTVNSLWQLYLFFGVIAGIGAAAYVPLITGVSGWFDEKKGLALGIVVAGMGLGPTILSPIANHLISLYGWRQTFLILGIITGIIIVLAAQIIRSNPHRLGLVSPGDESITGIEAIETANRTDTVSISRKRDFTFKLAVRERRFWLIVIPYSLWCVAIIAVPVHAVPLMTDKGISSGSAANLLSLLMLSSMTGRVVMGALSDRIGRVKSIYICLGTNMLALLWLMFATNIWMFSLFAVAYGFTYGGGVPQWAALVGDIFGLTAMGAIFGTVVFFVTLFGTIGPILFGYIFDVTGSYNIAFLIAAILIAVGLFILSFIKKQKRVPW